MISNKWMKEAFSSYRRFRSNKRGYSTENASKGQSYSSNSTAKELNPPKRKPRRYATKLVFATTVGVVAYQYFYGNQQINKLDQVMTLLKNKDNPEVVLEGLQSLSNCFVTKLRVFSGEANIRTYPSDSEMESLTHVLMDILINGDPGIKWNAISWIQKFSEENQAVRECLANDYVQTLIQKAMSSNIYENKHQEWLIASEILITLLKDDEVSSIIKNNNSSILEELVSNLESKTSVPMALIASSELSALVGRKSSIKGEDQGVGHNLVKYSLENNLSPTLKTTGITGASIASVIFFSFIGGAWNDLRNALKFSSNEKGPLRSVLSQRRAYIPLLFAFSADMILQRFLLFSSNVKLEIDEEKIKKFEENNFFESSNIMSECASNVNKYLKEIPVEIPLSLAGPMFQNTLFGITTITYLALGRHVFIPIVLALAYNHRDYLSSLNAVEYVKDIIEVSKKVDKQ